MKIVLYGSIVIITALLLYYTPKPSKDDVL